MTQFSDELLTRLERTGVIAVLIIDHVEQAVPVAQALLAGGVDAMELTLRTPVALDALRQIRREVPEMLAGIGTILSVSQVDEVVAADAAFGVAPGTRVEVIRAAQAHELPFAPGVVTPSDIETALSLGCRLLKFFPAEPSGGVEYLRSVAAPFAHLGVRYVPLGGVSLDNLGQYLQVPAVLAVGGSWLAPRELIQQGRWGDVEQRAREACAAVAQVRR